MEVIHLPHERKFVQVIARKVFRCMMEGDIYFTVERQFLMKRADLFDYEEVCILPFKEKLSEIRCDQSKYYIDFKTMSDVEFFQSVCANKTGRPTQKQVMKWLVPYGWCLVPNDHNVPKIKEPA
jgi:hypothetical protein